MVHPVYRIQGASIYRATQLSLITVHDAHVTGYTDILLLCSWTTGGTVVIDKSFTITPPPITNATLS